jgi:hypothetical protein
LQQIVKPQASRLIKWVISDKKHTKMQKWNFWGRRREEIWHNPPIASTKIYLRLSPPPPPP